MIISCGEDGKLIGVSLGADFVSEHEWGIPDLISSFDISKKDIGIKSRQIRICPGNLCNFVDNDKQKSYIFFIRSLSFKKRLENILKGIGFVL